MSGVDRALVRRRMQELGLAVTDVAAAAGLSRQTVHAVLKPGFRPLVPSVEAIAEVLGLEPSRLLMPSEAAELPEPPVERLIESSAAGNPRAFELLPARLVSMRGTLPRALQAGDAVRHQLVAAAAEMAGVLSPSPRLRALARFHAGRTCGRHAFFFGAGLMTPERIVQATPEPLRKHLVFGAFSLEDFRRHL